MQCINKKQETKTDKQTNMQNKKQTNNQTKNKKQRTKITVIHLENILAKQKEKHIIFHV